MEIWELLQRLQRQPSREGVLSGNKSQIQNVNPTPADIVNLLKGSGAGLAGMPVDLASMAMRPFGYSTPPEQTVGSSEWIGQQMGADPNSRAFTAGTFASPDPVDVLRAAQPLTDVIQAMAVAYGKAPDSLMGYSSRPGLQKGFDEQNYKKEIVVRVTFEDGQTFVDAMRGLNTPHAVERARRNWEGAKIEVLGEGKRGLSDLPEWENLTK